MDNQGRQSIGVLVVDSQTLFRAGLKAIIESNQSMTVVGEAASGSEAIAIAEREQPQIILLEIELREENGLVFLDSLMRASVESRVIVVTGLDDEEIHCRAVHRGAMGVVLKDEPGEVLIKAIEKVHAGEVWIDRAMVARVLSSKAKPAADTIDLEAIKISSLTDREREVIALVCEGLKTRQIAERLFISEKTVSNHLASIYDKLGVTDRLDLALYAYRQRMIRLPHPEPGSLRSLG